MLRSVIVGMLLFSAAIVTAQPQIKDITPNEPGLTVEQIATGGSFSEKNSYALLKKDGIQSLALYSEMDRWYNIPLPKKIGEIKEIVGFGGGVYILAGNPSGENSLHRWVGPGWTEIKLGSLRGTVEHIYQVYAGDLVATGNFSEGGKPYQVAYLVDGKKWETFTKQRLSGEAAIAFENSSVEKIFPNTGCLLVKNNSTGEYRILWTGVISPAKLSDALPGPVTDLVLHSRDSITVLGNANGNTFVLRTSDKAWTPVNLDKIPLVKIEKIYPQPLVKVLYQGIDKAGRRVFTGQKQKNYWEFPYSLPDMEVLVDAPFQKFLIDKEQRLYVLNVYLGETLEGIDFFPPITEIADRAPYDLKAKVIKEKISEEAAQKKKKWDAVKTMEDLVIFYGNDKELRDLNRLKAYLSFTDAGAGSVQDRIAEVGWESLQIRSSALVYKNKAWALSETPKDSAMRNAFIKYMEAMYRRSEITGNMITAVKNGTFAQSRSSLSEQNKHAASVMIERGKLLNAAMNAYARESTRPTIGDAFKSLGDALKPTMQN